MIQTWYRMAFGRKLFLRKRFAAFNLQQLFRCMRSKLILKALKIEARSLFNVAKERDEFKKELVRLRQELEVVKAAATGFAESSSNYGQITVKKQNRVYKDNESGNETASVISSVYNESLVEEVIRKDQEIKRLRREIEYLKQFSPIKDHTQLSTISVLTSTEFSLLDNEDICSREIELSPREHTYQSSERELLTRLSVSFDNHIHLAVHALDEDALSVAISCSDDLMSDVNQGNATGKTPLHLAVMSSNRSIVEFLLEKECIINVQDDFGNTPLHYAQSSGMIKLLMEKGSNPNIPNHEGSCALHYASQRLDVESCRILLSHGADLNTADHDQWLTPFHVLMLASVDSNDGCSRALEITGLFCGDQSLALDEQDKDGNTVLHYACIGSNNCIDEIITLLLQCGANPNILNRRGQTALQLLLRNRFISSFESYHDLVWLMLKHGADVNTPTQSGSTPLTQAVYQEDMSNHERHTLEYGDVEQEQQSYQRIIMAPPGKIGITFVDFGGKAMVSHISDDSPLYGLIFLRDILVAVDECAVTEMQVKDIMKILLDRRDRKQRALVVMSTVHVP